MTDSENFLPGGGGRRYTSDATGESLAEAEWRNRLKRWDSSCLARSAFAASLLRRDNLRVVWWTGLELSGAARSAVPID
jgi:hypothetical protein